MYISWLNLCIQHCSWCIHGDVYGPWAAQPCVSRTKEGWQKKRRVRTGSQLGWMNGHRAAREGKCLSTEVKLLRLLESEAKICGESEWNEDHTDNPATAVPTPDKNSSPLESAVVWSWNIEIWKTIPGQGLIHWREMLWGNLMEKIAVENASEGKPANLRKGDTAESHRQ